MRRTVVVSMSVVAVLLLVVAQRASGSLPEKQVVVDLHP